MTTLEPTEDKSLSDILAETRAAKPQTEPDATEPDPEPDEVEDEGQEAEAHRQEPIEPPISMSAEEKEQFRNLPREAQEFLVRRESEQNSLLKKRTDELARLIESAQAEHSRFAEERQKYLEQVDSAKPVKPRQSEFRKDGYFDKDAYDEAVLAYEESVEAWEERNAEAEKIRKQIEAEQQQELEQFQQKTISDLQEYWPEILDPQKGAEIQARVVNYLAENLGLGQQQAIETLKRSSGAELLLVRKAMERDEGVLSIKAKKSAPKAMRPGSPDKPPVSRKLQEEKRAVIKKLREDGRSMESLDAAVQFLKKKSGS